jgi:hypothetical protein
MVVGHRRKEEFEKDDYEYDHDHDYDEESGGVTWLDILGQFVDCAGVKVKNFS